MQYKFKNILVTGSHGSIGSVVCPELRKLGYSVQGIDIGYFLDCMMNVCVDGPLFAKKHLDEISSTDLDGIDAVIHLAGLQNDPMKNTLPGKVYDMEYEHTKNLTDICRVLGIQFIFASSCSVYGFGSSEQLNESSPVKPLTPYSQNKLRLEKYLHSIANNNFNPVMLRFATVYGYSPRMRFDLYINMFAGMALTKKKIQLNSDGTAWRPNLYIGDIARVLHAVLNYNFEKPTVINVGNENSNIQVVNAVDIIKKHEKGVTTCLLQSKNNNLYGDQYVTSKTDKRSYKVDFSKINYLFGLDVCSTDIEEGISKLIHELKTVDNLENKIKDQHFFRLQWTQELIKNNLINKQFKWYKL